jgi:hypothetical protein
MKCSTSIPKNFLKPLCAFADSFLETFCCCFGYGPPQTPYEAMHRQEMERRRLIAKDQKHRRQQYQKALQEKHRLSQQMAWTNAASLKNNNNSNVQANTATTTTANE